MKQPAQKPKIDQKRDLRVELDQLERILDELKVLYEQYFVGIIPLTPDKLHNEAKRLINSLSKAPFRSSALNFRLKTLRNRYNTLNTYWTRVLRQKEEGTYSKDVFKANLRERFALEDEHSGTAEGQAEGQMAALFRTYKSTLEKQSGAAQKLDYKAFEKTLVQRAKALKEKHSGKKLVFKVVVKDGKVTIQAQVKG